MLTDNPALVKLLDEELIGFLTAVSPDGQPQASPVWYLRDGEDIVVYNRPSSPRLVSIAANPKVAFNLRGDRHGDVVVTLEGEARVEDLPLPTEFPGYLDKYGSEIVRIGFTPEAFGVGYNVALRIVVTRVRAEGLDRSQD
jgi:PPOX class probable F420-dependent enzyme